MSAEFERLVAQFEKFQTKIKQIEKPMADIDQLQSEISELEASATSSDRSITVVAGPGGSIKDIRLTPDALRQQPGALSAAIMSTLQQAVAESARKQAGVVQQHMGSGMHLMDQVLEAQAEALGTTPDDLRSKMSDAPTTPADAAEYDDDGASPLISRPDHRTSPPPPSSSDSDGDQYLNNLFRDDEEGR